MASALSVSKILAEFAFETAGQDIPPDTSRIIELSVFDWATCGIAGIAEPVSTIVRQMIRSENQANEANLIGGGRAAARSAALLNGTISHALDYDDTHFAHIGHPSVVVVSAALAAAQKVSANGADFLTAVAIGFETSIRIGQWLGRSHYQAGFHQTATAGCIGATLAVGKLLSLSSVQLQHAIGIASTRASGLKSQFGTMGKPYNAGIAASNAVEAGLLAAGGFVSNPTALEDAQGFGPTHSGDNMLDAFNGLGQMYILDTVSYKFHACCHGTHAAIEALLILAPEITNHNDITAVNIRTHPRWMSVCNIVTPQTGLEAKFSFRLTAAFVLSGINTGAISSFTDAACSEPSLVDLRDRVSVHADTKISETEAWVEIELKKATAISAHFDLTSPLDIEDKRRRLLEKSASLVGNSRSNGIWAAIKNLEVSDNLTDFIEAIS